MLALRSSLITRSLRQSICIRSLSDSPSQPDDPASPSRSHILTQSPHLKEILDSIIRVNHAGELGAQRIYAGQLDALKGTACEPMIQHMADQEQEHAETFNRLIFEYRVRPTLMNPVWDTFGYTLGYVTGIMGKEAAMACTVAVETVIGEHYNEQLRKLNELGIEEKELRGYIAKFRDEELEHLDIGLKNDAEKAVAYPALTSAVSAATSFAIWVSKRI
eukprot:TRINITY_DN10001_c0_g1_i1.p1 TRINITY_DN10001_c0_g1~~TRINITY_DN10001_c0_g1_i1.p1  ORF type:complete len:219 (-),score=67.09 TRINITY_DN10001_c0_g1_i1:64-720(-)